jgi:aryl-alcohol dehydrogenase-like predicted oxidoreductase
MRRPSHVALGAWSGGRFMHYGEPLDDERLAALLRPGADVDTVITADAYGAGAGDALVGRALAGVPRSSFCLVGAIGHDVYEGERQGSKGYPRFTDPALRGPEAYADYVRMATERSLERCGVDAFDVLLLHNPDRIGFTSDAVWDALRDVRDAGLAGALGVAPGPANGFVLDLIGCLDEFGEVIDWGMVILNPFEPWPAELVLPAAERAGVELITRVADFGGIFHDDVKPGHAFAERDHRAFRPDGWVEQGAGKLERVRPVAERHGLTTLQLACAWNLAQPAVACAVPTLIQEIGPGARPVEEKRAELAATPAAPVLTADDLAEIRRIGDNRGCMALKGGVPDHEGDELPDRWTLSPELEAVAERWSIDPRAALRKTTA